MSNLKSSSKAALAVLMAGAMGLAGTASAQSYGPQPQRPVGSGIIGCDAPGGRQQAGAVIGGLLGAALGTQISRNERELGAVGGGVLGAAAGSYIGCRQQRARLDNYNAGYNNGQAETAAQANAYVATSNLRIRSGPSTGYGQVGSLSAGQSFQVAGSQGEWLQLAGGGYVHSGYVRRAY